MQEKKIEITDLYTPTELLELYPHVQYNAREIGYMLMLGLIRGTKGKTFTLISRESFDELLGYCEKKGLGKIPSPEALQ